MNSINFYYLTYFKECVLLHIFIQFSFTETLAVFQFITYYHRIRINTIHLRLFKHENQDLLRRNTSEAQWRSHCRMREIPFSFMAEIKFYGRYNIKLHSLYVNLIAFGWGRNIRAIGYWSSSVMMPVLKTTGKSGVLPTGKPLLVGASYPSDVNYPRLCKWHWIKN